MRPFHTAGLRTGTALALAVACLVAAGCTADDEPVPPPSARVVASTTWVGALAKAAGVADLAVVAPANVPDPAAFEPTPGELAAAGRAERVLYAETDAFADELRAAAGDARPVPVKLARTPAEIKAEVLRLGQALGTEQAARRWVAEFDSEVGALIANVQGVAPIPPFTAVTHSDVAHWAEFTGLRVVGEYGPGPVPADRLPKLTAARPKLLLASVHRPADTPAIPGAIRVELANYPGADLDLFAVFTTNADKVSTTFAK